MENLELYEKVRSVPEDAKKKITGGRLNGMTDINPMWRIKTLTEQFGPCGIGWYYKPVDKDLKPCGNEIVAFVDIALYIKIDGEWSKPIFGSGGSKFATQEKNGIFVSDECYKMATTDAISVACKQLGIGADVYWAADVTKYSGKRSVNPDSFKKLDTQMNGDTSSTETSRLTDAQYNTIIKSLKERHRTQKEVMDRFKVKNIRNMTIEQFREFMDEINPPAATESDMKQAIPPDNFGLPFN